MGLFDTKVGGTLAGNLFREFAKGASGGIFGNGAMLRNAGETDEQYQQRLLAGLGGAANGFQQGTASGAQGFKEGVKLSLIREYTGRYLPTLLFMALLGIGAWLLVKINTRKK